METRVCGQEDYSSNVKVFMEEHGLHRIIAFSGGSDAEIPGVPQDDELQKQYKELMQSLERRIVEGALRKLRNYQIAILTGGTKWGIPNTATIVAKEYDMKTIGVYPLAGRKHALSADYLDLALCVEPLVNESRWGDESPIFTSLLDGVIVYGGGAGTLIECAHILKTNEALIKSGEPAKYIVPIAGTGGVADGLPFIWGKAEVRSKCMPHQRVTSGIDAVDILCDKLHLDDYIRL